MYEKLVWALEECVFKPKKRIMIVVSIPPRKNLIKELLLEILTNHHWELTVASCRDNLIEFENESYIKVTVARETICGNRCGTLLYDTDINEEILHTVVFPYATIPHQYPLRDHGGTLHLIQESKCRKIPLDFKYFK